MSRLFNQTCRDYFFDNVATNVLTTATTFSTMPPLIVLYRCDSFWSIMTRIFSRPQRLFFRPCRDYVFKLVATNASTTVTNFSTMTRLIFCTAANHFSTVPQLIFCTAANHFSTVPQPIFRPPRLNCRPFCDYKYSTTATNFSIMPRLCF